jgi:CshA-type fibril repeat protein/VCBS repeat-containing protein
VGHSKQRVTFRAATTRSTGRPRRGVTFAAVVALVAAGVATDLVLGAPASAASPHATPQGSACLVPFPAFVNGGFETPTSNGAQDFPAANATNPTPGIGWSTNDPDSYLEIWVNNYTDSHTGLATPSDTGGQFDELQADGEDAIWQDIATTPGSTIVYSFAHRGRTGTDSMEFEAGAQTGGFVQNSQLTVLKTATDSNTAWGHYSGTYVVPAGQTTTRFAFNFVSSSSGIAQIGNFIDSLSIGIASNACDDSATALQGHTTSIPVLANDGGSGLTTSLPSTTSANGATLSVNSATGAVNYTPAAGFSGTDAFTYTATDKYGNTSNATVTVTVPPLPTAANLTSSGPTPTAQQVTVTIPAGGSATLLSGGSPVSTVAVPNQGTYTLSGTTITFTPVTGYTGTATAVQYQVTDSYGQTAAGTYTPTVVPADSNDARTVADGQALSASVPVATGTGPFTYAAVTQPADGTLTFHSDGTYTYTPTTPFSGTDSFTYTATGAGGTSAAKTVTITVTPTAVNDSFTTGYQTSHTAAGSTLTGNDLGTGLSITSVGSAASGTVALNGTNYTYTPAAGFSGTTGFTYTAVDSSGNPETGNVTVTVLPAPPVAVADSGQTTTGVALTTGTNLLSNDTGAGPLSATKATDPGHGTVTVNANGSYTYTPTTGFSGTDTFTYTATDVDNQTSAPATVTITVLPQAQSDSQSTPAGQTLATSVPTAIGTGPFTYAGTTSTTHGTLTVNADGTYSYTPTTGFTGTDSFTYTATDAAGGTSAPATVTITVVNPAAPVAHNDSATTPSGQELTSGTNLLANDTGTGPLTATKATDPSHGTVTVDPSGTYDYTPTAGFSGTDTFTYTTKDAVGQVSAPATVTIAVIPVAKADSYTTVGGTTLNETAAGGVLANDLGTTLTVGSHTNPGHGTLTLNADGSFAYTPTLGFSGNDTFTYQAKDASGQLSPAATVTITVNDPSAPVAANDAASTTAGTTLTSGADVLNNDAGTGTLTPTVVTQPAHGSVTLNADGTYSYTPNSGFSGIDTFTYKDADAFLQTSNTATVTITVSPSSQPDSATLTGGSAYAGTSVLNNDDGSGLTAVEVAGPAHGSLTLNPDGTYSYTPTLGYAGTDTFTYQAKDSSGRLSPVTTVTLDVVEPAAPVAEPDTLTAAAGDNGASGTNLLSNDMGTVPLTASLGTAPQHGTATVNANGTYTYTPTPGYSGPDSFTYVATDPYGQTSTGTVTVTVLPTAAPDSVSVASGATLSTSVPTASGTGPFMAAAVTQPVHGTLTLNPNGSYTYTPTGTYVGPDSFTYTETDAFGGTSAPATVSISVTQPAAPVGTADAGATVAGTPYDGSSVLSNDSGTGTLTAVKASDPVHGTVTIDTDGTYLYTPAAGFSGDDSFTYVIHDAYGNVSSPVTVSMVVTPKAVDDAASVVADGSLNGTSVLANDLGTGLTPTLGTGVSHGTLTLQSDGTYTYVPTPGYVGADSFTYTVTDAAGRTSAPATVTLTVQQPAAPVGVADSGSTTAGTPLHQTTSVLGNDSGTGTLTAVKDTDPANGSVTVNADGTYTYTPDNGFSGTDSFTYDIHDSFGNVSSPVTVTITVVPVAVDDSATVVAGTTLSGTSVLGNDLGDGLTASLGTAPTHGSLTLNADGTYTYTPSGTFVGTDSFTYTASGNGGTSAPATVTIAVTQPGAPVGGPDTATTTAGSTLNAPSVLSNDSGAGSLTAVDATTPGYGTVTLNTDGTYSYTPATGFSGTDTFTYRDQDAYGGLSQPVTVTITVDPTALADTATVAADGVLHETTSVLANDLGTGLTAVLVTGPAHGTVTLNSDGTYTYTPDTGYAGSDSFTYQAEDASGNLSAPVTVSLGVGQPAAPVGTADTGTTTAGTALDGSSVLGNDSGTGALTVTEATGPSDGTLSLDSDGTYVYTPDAGFSGSDEFTYVIHDAFGNTSSAVPVTITVDPSAVADTADVAAGGTLNEMTSVLANDLGTALTAVHVSGPTHGTLVLNVDGTYTYTPVVGYVGPDSFTYEAEDEFGDLSAPATVSIGVGIPPAPVGTNDTGTGAAGSTLHGGSVLANDSGTGTLSAVEATPPAHGTLNLASDGVYTYVPAAGYSGPDSFTYTISDQYGNVSTPVTVNLTVDPTAKPDLATLTEGTTLHGTTVLGNDLGTGPLTAVKISGTSHGTLTLAANGTYTYVPAIGFTGTDTFTYEVEDAFGNLSAPVTVTLHVTATVIAPPVVTGGTPQTIPVGSTPKPITFTTGAGPATVTTSDPGKLPPGLTLLSSGAFSGTATTPGTYTFPVTITDADGHVTTVEATIVVAPKPTAAAPGGGLPFTGGPWLVLIDLGAMLTAAGAFLLVAARRRRVRQLP